MLFNGTNSDAGSKAIYRDWLNRNAGTDRISGSTSSDMRAALIENFRDSASILIATEAAAEGINLQFCNLVVNYDLPWNPQRIEQRIGRCHRYGQKFDVVVVNFLNKENAADQRVYRLLDQKFRLFDGVFGASDEVLGAIESGVDFEKRIAAIYQRCRTPEQIEFEFDQLQRELEGEIAQGQSDAREKLLDNFDQEVIEKVRMQSHDVLDRFNERLWSVTRHVLADYADFDGSSYAFTLRSNPFPGETIHPGPYRMAKGVEDANTFRVGHPLAQRILGRARDLATPTASITFRYSGSGKKISILEPLVGRSGWLTCRRLTTEALETEDVILLAGFADAGLAPTASPVETLDDGQCRRLFDLPAADEGPIDCPLEIAARLDGALAPLRQETLERMASRNGDWFETEMSKLDGWAEDRRASFKAQLNEIEGQLKDARRASRLAGTLPEKLEKQRAIRTLEGKRDEADHEYEQAKREIDRQKDALLDEISRRMQQQTTEERLFSARWQLI